jgi:alpha-methylacyl-CoA racemase
MVLADLGAEVLRIDRAGQPQRRIDLVSRGRRRVALDLKRPDGLAAALDLIAAADELIEGYRPGVAERLGVGPDACLERDYGGGGMLPVIGILSALFERARSGAGQVVDAAMIDGVALLTTRRFDEWRELLEGVVQPAPAPRFSRTPPGPPRPPADGTETAEEVVRPWTRR